MTGALAALVTTCACDGCFQFTTPDAGVREDAGLEAPLVVINEAMSKNTTVVDNAGEADDWIELHNATDEPVDLSGAFLSDDPVEFNKGVLPEGTVIAGGGYLLVFCDDTPAQGTPAEPHVAFKLSSSGDTVLLTRSDGAALDTLAVPALLDDESFGQPLDDVDAEPALLLEPTPRARNSEARTPTDGGIAYDAGPECEPPFATPPDVIVSEVLVDNATGLTDEAGEREPWIELENTGDVDIDNDDLRLSDNVDDPLVSASFLAGGPLVAGERRVFFADGDLSGGAAHLSIRLDALTDSVVVLADRCGTVLRTLPLQPAGTDVSVCVLANNTAASCVPTPGEANQPQ